MANIEEPGNYPVGRELRVVVVVIVLGISAIGFYQFDKSRFAALPEEGSLVVNINTATTEEINSLPDISPIQAIQIASNRPYASVEELDRIPGIGPAQLEKLRPYVKLEGPTAPRS